MRNMSFISVWIEGDYPEFETGSLNGLLLYYPNNMNFNKFSHRMTLFPFKINSKIHHCKVQDKV